MAHLELQEKSQGEADLKKSIKLLPTAPAMNALGNISLNQGDTVTAKKYFSAAAGSNSSAGKAASHSLVQLDLPDNPGKYLQLRFGRDKSDYLLVQITNRTAQDVKDINFIVQFRDSTKNVRQVQLQLPGRLGAQKSKTVATRIGPFDSLKQVRGEVIRARVVESP